MTDGAHANIGAENAMKAILSGAPVVQMTPEEFEAMVRGIDLTPGGPFSYDSGATATARLVLEMYERYPQTQELSDENEYLRTPDGNIDWAVGIKTNVTIYEILKQLHPEQSELFADLTGFMWGWAVNAARTILDLGPIRNPAIMTFRVEGAEEEE